MFILSVCVDFYWAFYVEITGKVAEKLQDCLKKKVKNTVSAQICAQLNFHISFILLKCNPVQKISCAHACADLFYGLFANENDSVIMPQIGSVRYNLRCSKTLKVAKMLKDD